MIPTWKPEGIAENICWKAQKKIGKQKEVLVK
jgi:hypothetical protein